jgi:hypothetical protein
MTKVLPKDYATLLVQIKERVRAGNRERLTLYWDIRRMIAVKQRDAAHGDTIVELRDLPKMQRPVAQIGWTPNLIAPQPVVQQRAAQLSSFCPTAQRNRANGGRDRGGTGRERTTEMNEAAELCNGITGEI